MRTIMKPSIEIGEQINFKMYENGEIKTLTCIDYWRDGEENEDGEEIVGTYGWDDNVICYKFKDKEGKIFFMEDESQTLVEIDEDGNWDWNEELGEIYHNCTILKSLDEKYDFSKLSEQDLRNILNYIEEVTTVD